MARKPANYIGARFGRYTVLQEAAPVKRCDGAPRRMVECRCDCGTVRIVELEALRRGHTYSCGCLRKETARDRMKACWRAYKGDPS